MALFLYYLPPLGIINVTQPSVIEHFLWSDIPWEHWIAKIMRERAALSWHVLLLPMTQLPHRPDSVYIRMVQKENRIIR